MVNQTATISNQIFPYVTEVLKTNEILDNVGQGGQFLKENKVVMVELPLIRGLPIR